MADFTALAIDSGVGDYHLNQFRIAFRPPIGNTGEHTGANARERPDRSFSDVLQK